MLSTRSKYLRENFQCFTKKKNAQEKKKRKQCYESPQISGCIIFLNVTPAKMQRFIMRCLETCTKILPCVPAEQRIYRLPTQFYHH